MGEGVPKMAKKIQTSFMDDPLLACSLYLMLYHNCCPFGNLWLSVFFFIFCAAYETERLFIFKFSFCAHEINWNEQSKFFPVCTKGQKTSETDYIVFISSKHKRKSFFNSALCCTFATRYLLFLDGTPFNVYYHIISASWT